MVKERELSINVVKPDKPKVSGLEPKGNAAGTGAGLSPVMGKALYGHVAGGQREPNPILSFVRNMVSP